MRVIQVHGERKRGTRNAAIVAIYFARAGAVYIDSIERSSISIFDPLRDPFNDPSYFITVARMV